MKTCLRGCISLFWQEKVQKKAAVDCKNKNCGLCADTLFYVWIVTRWLKKNPLRGEQAASVAGSYEAELL